VLVSRLTSGSGRTLGQYPPEVTHHYLAFRYNKEMSESCKVHVQIFNFLDKLKVHVIEAGKTLMAQVDAGTYEPRDCMSAAEKALLENSEVIRKDYADNKISAATLLSHAADHFRIKEVRKELNACRDQRPTDEQGYPDEEDEDNPEEQGDELSQSVLEPIVTVNNESGECRPKLYHCMCC